MKLIELTYSNGRRILIKSEHITALAEMDEVADGSIVCVTGGNDFVVKENLAAILSAIDLLEAEAGTGA